MVIGEPVDNVEAPLVLLKFTDAAAPRQSLYINPEHVCLIRGIDGSRSHAIVYLAGGYHIEVEEGADEVFRQVERSRDQRPQAA
jgi:hypothetical protein